MIANTSLTRNLQHNINPAVGLFCLNQANNQPIRWEYLGECIDRAAADFITANNAAPGLRPMVAAAIGAHMYPAVADVLAGDPHGLETNAQGLANAFRAAAFASFHMIRKLADAVASNEPVTDQVTDSAPEPAQLWTLTDVENFGQTTGSPFTMTGSMAELASYLIDTDLEGDDKTAVQRIANRMAGSGIIASDDIEFLSECGITIVLNPARPGAAHHD